MHFLNKRPPVLRVDLVSILLYATHLSPLHPFHHIQEPIKYRSIDITSPHVVSDITIKMLLDTTNSDAITTIL